MNFLKKIFWRRNDYETINSQESPAFGYLAFILCTFVLLREFYPIDSFITQYLVSPPLNFNINQINEQIYPTGLFASFVLLIVFFFITDYLRYKPVIILNGISGILTYGLLLGKPTLSILCVEQVCYGLFFASTIASSTYLYAKVDDTNKYQEIAALVQACALFGRFFRGIFSQLILSFSGLPQITLVYFSTGGLVLATVWSFFIPSVTHSIYFHRVEKLQCENTNENFSAVVQRIVYDFKIAYSNPYVLKWSIWWSTTYGVYNLILVYSQVLWQTVLEENDNNIQLMNGAVDSIYTLTSAGASYCIGFVKFDWKTNTDLILPIVSSIFACLTQFMYWNSSLLVLYFVYIVLGCIFQTVLTIAHSEVAQNIEKDSYALIFGFNLAVALGSSYLITALFIQGWIMLLSLKQQFLLYTLCFVGMAFFYLTRLNWRCRKNLT